MLSLRLINNIYQGDNMTQKETQKETKKEGLDLAQLFKSPKLFNEDVLDNMPKEKLEEVLTILNKIK